MAVDNVRARFDQLVADAGTVGGKIKAILADVAETINGLFGDDSHPTQGTIISRLEQAAHVAVTSPALAIAATDDTEQAPDPTTAGQTEEPASSSPAPDSSAPGPSSPEPTSAEQSTPSEGTSQQ